MVSLHTPCEYLRLRWSIIALLVKAEGWDRVAKQSGEESATGVIAGGSDTCFARFVYLMVAHRLQVSSFVPS